MFFVVADRPAKSLGHEETFRHDIYELVALRHHVLRMSDAVAEALRGELLAGRTVTVKVRFADFETITRGRTIDPTNVVARAATRWRRC